jgi:hypothetical protein
VGTGSDRGPGQHHPGHGLRRPNLGPYSAPL